MVCTEHQHIQQDTRIVRFVYSFHFLPSPECQNYQSFTSSNRKVTYYSARPYSCDSGLGPDWYRFQAAAGTRMPISCTPIARCNTYGTGWLNGGHPTVAEGRVTRQVCFHYWSNCCQSSTIIEVRNCGSFYVYHLNGTDTKNYCQLGYCGTD